MGYADSKLRAAKPIMLKPGNTVTLHSVTATVIESGDGYLVAHDDTLGLALCLTRNILPVPVGVNPYIGERRYG